MRYLKKKVFVTDILLVLLLLKLYRALSRAISHSSLSKGVTGCHSRSGKLASFVERDGRQILVIYCEPVDPRLLFGNLPLVRPDSERSEERHTRKNTGRLLGGFEYHLAVLKHPALSEWSEQPKL